ncbi:hypothetical protein Q2941_05615 [Bradyrhizobium sp. UFLA05-153]
MLKQWIAAMIVVACCAPTPAAGQPILLTCTGTFGQLGTEWIQGKLSPTSAAIDLDRRTVQVLGVTYDIALIKETELVLSGSSSELVFFGTVDRTAGTISISGMLPEEYAKLQNGKSAQASTNFSLTCAPAKQRLF